MNNIVADLVHMDRVRSLLKTITARKRYLEHRFPMPASSVPTIIVVEEDP